MSRFVSRLAACFIVASLAGACAGGKPAPRAATNGPAVMVPLGPPLDPQKTLTGARKLAERLPAEALDVRAAALAIGDDPAKLFAFVRDEIAFDPYRGSLRGAVGTLQARAGNSLDRSLLLLALLGDRPTKLVSGKLADDRARALLERAKRPRANPKPVALDVNEVAQLTGLSVADLRGRADAVAANARSAGKRLGDRVELDQKQIETALADARVTLAAPTGPRLEDVRDHFWVELESDGTTKDLDPSLADAQIGQRLASSGGVEVSTSPLPDELSQTVSIRLVSGTSVLLERTLTTASLAGRPPIELGFFPVDASEPATTFAPALVLGDENLAGEPFSISAAPAAAAREDSETSGLGSALGGLGGAAPSVGATKVEEIALELTLGGAGLPAEKITRAVAARPEPGVVGEARVEAVREQLTALYHLAIVTGPVPDAWMGKQSLALLELLGDVEKKSEPKKDGEEPARSSPFVPMDLLNLAQALAQGEKNPWLGTSFAGRRYAARPLVVAQRARVRSVGSGKVALVRSLDIMRNRQESIDGSATDALREGIFLTELERGLGGAGEVYNTAEVFARSPGPVVVVRPGETARLDKLGLPAAARRRVAEDLATGYAVILPHAPATIAGAPAFGWWRVALAGGESLGRMQGGEGQSMTETAITKGIALSPSASAFLLKRYCKGTTGVCHPCLIATLAGVGVVTGFAGGWVANITESGSWLQLLGVVGVAAYGTAGEGGNVVRCVDAFVGQ